MAANPGVLPLPALDDEADPLVGGDRTDAARVVGIFPNEASVIRLVCVVLADTHDEWQAGDRRYRCEGSMAKLYPERDTGAVAELSTGD